MTSLPVSVLPVKAILSMPGWAVHPLSQIVAGERAEDADGSACFASSPSFRGHSGVNGEDCEERHELLGVRFEQVAHFGDDTLTLLEGRRGPSGKRGARHRDGTVEGRLVGDWYLGDGVFGREIEDGRRRPSSQACRLS
jgi:hypothetical protein